jgi:putative restriction endonuclease
VVLTVRKQPSGGRGEIELVGEQAGISAKDLDGFGFELQTPFGLKHTEVILSHQGGKRRLRLTADVPHLPRQLAALAMLPPSIRDERKVSDALPVIITNRYILDVDVGLVTLDGLAGMATIRPVTYRARSGTLEDAHHREFIDAASRLELIQRVYNSCERLAEPISSAVSRHRQVLTTTHVVGLDAELAVKEIMDALNGTSPEEYLPGTDPLPVLAMMIGASGPVELPLPTETPVDEPEIRLRTESIFRARRVRGASGTRFRSVVQTAYDYRCAFCGLRAPTVTSGARAGVDAAHILPWGEYDLDVVTNGLLLCKQHHWAFDNHVLILHCSGDNYELELDQGWAEQIGGDARTLDELNRVVGVLRQDRLPGHRNEWPSRQFIDRLYAR